MKLYQENKYLVLVSGWSGRVFGQDKIDTEAQQEVTTRITSNQSLYTLDI